MDAYCVNRTGGFIEVAYDQAFGGEFDQGSE